MSARERQCNCDYESDLQSSPAFRQGPLNVSLTKVKRRLRPGLASSPTSSTTQRYCTLLSQLQDATDSLVTLMYTNVDYLAKKATFKQVNPSVPVTQEIPDAEEPAAFEGELFLRVSLLLDLLLNRSLFRALSALLCLPATSKQTPSRG